MKVFYLFFGMYLFILSFYYIYIYFLYIYYVIKCPSSLLFLTPAQLVAVMHLKKLVCQPPINKRRRRNFHSCSIKSSEER